MKRLLAGLMALAVAATVANAAEPNQNSKGMEAGVQTAKKFKFTKNENATVDYLLFLPKDYKAAGGQKDAKRWPLIVFLHGAGERGADIRKVAIHGPPSFVTNKADFPFIVLSPQCPEGRIWSREVVLKLLDDIMANYAVDPERVYLTGLSMGGYGTWDIGLSNPERFAAIVPICGGGETISSLLLTREKSDALKTLGIWAFHGAKDPVVPLAESQRMVEAVKRFGAKDVKLTVYPEANHNSWTETYNNPELYQWLLEHRRAAR